MDTDTDNLLARFLFGTGIELSRGQEKPAIAVPGLSIRTCNLDVGTAGLPSLAGDTENFVIATGVLDSVSDADATLQEIHRVLRPGGVALITLMDRRYTPDGTGRWSQSEFFSVLANSVSAMQLTWELLDATFALDAARPEFGFALRKPEAAIDSALAARRLTAAFDALHDRAERIEDVARALNDSQSLLVDVEGKFRRLQTDMNAIYSSAAWWLANGMQVRARRLAPPGTRRQRTLHNVAHGTAVLLDEGPRSFARRLKRRRERRRLIPGDDVTEQRREEYRAWLKRNEPDAQRLRDMAAENALWPYRPRISIVMPVYNPEASWLEEAIVSVMKQVYTEWELCIANDASTHAHVRATLDRHAHADARIKVVHRERNGGIAQASNTALTLATGNYVSFLDNDDVLRPHALHSLVEYLQIHSDTGIVYSDEDKVLVSGELGDPMFKPDWSPDLLVSWNYITHLVLIRRDLVAAAGGFREGYDGSQDHDLLLRVSEMTEHIGHVPQVLYSWRMVPGSAALNADYKPLARETGRRAVADALRRRGIDSRVEFGSNPGLYHPRRFITGTPSVGIIIPTRDRLDLLRKCIESIEQETTYRYFSITIVDNSSRHPQTLAYLEASQHQVIRYPHPFNYSKIINLAAQHIDAEHLLLLNNDITVVSPGWIEALLEHSQRPEIGAVGGRLLYPGGGVQHEGIIVGRGKLAGNVEMRWPVVRETSAVTGACMMTRRSVFDEVGGFDEALRVGFNDVDYCLRVRQKGYRILYTPHAELIHHESASRGPMNPIDDQRRFVARWGDPNTIEDPYLNYNVMWPNPLELRETS
jgi:GT2 family glycosyltransferase/SAM-dependent methyltransferase